MRRLLSVPSWAIFAAVLASATSVSAQEGLYVTEFQAFNTSTLADADGDFSDWI